MVALNKKVLLACLALSAVGGLALALLSKDPGPRGLVLVNGSITASGKPLQKGIVVFHPNKDKNNLATDEPRGEIKPSGGYELSSRGHLGAPPGWYRVAVFAVEVQVSPDGKHRTPIALVDKKYRDPLTSGIEVKVVPNVTDGVYDLTLSNNRN